MSGRDRARVPTIQECAGPADKGTAVCFGGKDSGVAVLSRLTFTVLHDLLGTLPQTAPLGTDPHLGGPRVGRCRRRVLAGVEADGAGGPQHGDLGDDGFHRLDDDDFSAADDYDEANGDNDDYQASIGR